MTLNGSRSVDHGQGAGGAALDYLLRPGNADSNTAADLLAALDLVRGPAARAAITMHVCIDTIYCTWVYGCQLSL